MANSRRDVHRNLSPRRGDLRMVVGEEVDLAYGREPTIYVVVGASDQSAWDGHKRLHVLVGGHTTTWPWTAVRQDVLVRRSNGRCR